MVSGFFTSPLDQDRMESGDATEIATYSTWLTLSRPSNSRALSFVLIIGFVLSDGRLWMSHRGQRGHGFCRLVHRVGITDLHVQAQRLHLLDQHVEGFRDAGFQAVIAFYNAFVNTGPALNVIGLDGE